ncbi:MAG: hypothetical protein QOJ39_513 [Candidatus Eremiobacteraeota bacterium]|jgi:hypothetical protein|nr:hypothetical protein [Candidatus Eremiobacteraeota bacterium]MEA2718649.1 hypothetical protein [Candidatus Eremiobacteraeota bacterium]
MKAIIARIALGAALALGAATPVPAADAMKGGGMMMTHCPGGYVLNAVAGSGESGCATPRGGNGVIFLALKVTGEPAGAMQPAHIHRGKCGSNGPVVLPLKPVVNGMSATTIPMAKWSMYNHGGFYINIHESAKNIPHVVSCANITAMGGHGAM